ncbi:hypothetical protein ACLOJK_026711 [Asimina triloba]
MGRGQERDRHTKIIPTFTTIVIENLIEIDVRDSSRKNRLQLKQPYKEDKPLQPPPLAGRRPPHVFEEEVMAQRSLAGGKEDDDLPDDGGDSSVRGDVEGDYDDGGNKDESFRFQMI